PLQEERRDEGDSGADRILGAGEGLRRGATTAGGGELASNEEGKQWCQGKQCAQERLAEGPGDATDAAIAPVGELVGYRRRRRSKGRIGDQPRSKGETAEGRHITSFLSTKECGSVPLPSGMGVKAARPHGRHTYRRLAVRTPYAVQLEHAN